MQMEGGMGGSGCHWHTACRALVKRQKEATNGEVKMCFGEKVQQKNFFVKVLAKNRLEMASKETAFY